MEEDLHYLMDKEKEQRKKEGAKGQYHEKHLIADLLRNARTLKEAWG